MWTYLIKLSFKYSSGYIKQLHVGFEVAAHETAIIGCIYQGKKFAIIYYLLCYKFICSFSVFNFKLYLF